MITKKLLILAVFFPLLSYADLKPGSVSCFGADGYISSEWKVDKENVLVTISKFYLLSYEAPENEIFKMEAVFPASYCTQNPVEPGLISCSEQELGVIKLSFKDFDGNPLPAPEGVKRVLYFDTTRSLTTTANPNFSLQAYHFSLEYMKGFAYKTLRGDYTPQHCHLKF